MLPRLIAAMVIGIGIAQACDCTRLGVRDALASADIVFKGRIVQFRDHEGQRMVVFAVDQVWKGRVPRILEMAAIESGDACYGFWPGLLKLGNDLIIYAQDQGSRGFPSYITSLCDRTGLAKQASDFRELGPGRKPK